MIEKKQYESTLKMVAKWKRQVRKQDSGGLITIQNWGNIGFFFTSINPASAHKFWGQFFFWA